MLSAVHSDRSGRVYLSADYTAAAWDGATTIPLEDGLPLPEGSTLVPLADREAMGFDRWGRVHRLGSGRWALGAVLPPGHLRIGHPAYGEEPGVKRLVPRAYVAVGARPDGSLVAAALATDADPSHGAVPADLGDLAPRVAAGLRERPSNRVVRQLARCARDYRCAAARNAFLHRWECGLPIAAPANERPPDSVALAAGEEESPLEPATFKPDAQEIADVVVEHFTAGGGMASFGRACDGEPLLAARLVEEAVQRARARTSQGTIRLETNGSVPGALHRVIAAGLDAVTIRFASARAPTYDALHGPDGYRWMDVRASLRDAAATRVALDVAVAVLPGVTDRRSELDALIALLAELPAGTIQLRDLACDPHRAVALVPATEAPLGIGALVKRIREETPHFRVAAFARPLAAA